MVSSCSRRAGGGPADVVVHGLGWAVPLHGGEAEVAGDLLGEGPAYEVAYFPAGLGLVAGHPAFEVALAAVRQRQVRVREPVHQMDGGPQVHAYDVELGVRDVVATASAAKPADQAPGRVAVQAAPLGWRGRRRDPSRVVRGGPSARPGAGGRRRPRGRCGCARRPLLSGRSSRASWVRGRRSEVGQDGGYAGHLRRTPTLSGGSAAGQQERAATPEVVVKAQVSPGQSACLTGNQAFCATNTPTGSDLEYDVMSGQVWCWIGLSYLSPHPRPGSPGFGNGVRKRGGTQARVITLHDRFSFLRGRVHLP